VIEATVSGGSTLDFNVMTRRGRAMHSVTNELFGKHVAMNVAFRTVILVFALDPGLSVDDQLLDVHDTAIIREQGAVISVSIDQAAALVVRIVDFRPNVL
jgi:environmental stress-induced protein Ves